MKSLQLRDVIILCTLYIFYAFIFKPLETACLAVDAELPLAQIIYLFPVISFLLILFVPVFVVAFGDE